jgi:hypothetical protein
VWALFFSAGCALTLLPDGLNIAGKLVAQLPTREFEVRAEGWPRVVAGIQALISVGLLTLVVVSLAH